jgi:DNA-binding NarL/FixJ family response regulator
MSLTRTLRVVVAEDDVLLRAGIVRLLSDAGIAVAAEAGDAEDLMGKALAHEPDVVIVDVQMPPQRNDDGLVAALELRRRLPEIGILVLSQFNEAALARELIGDHPAGVGYLLKERVGDVAAFVDAIERVAQGGSALDPAVVSRMLGRPRHDDPLDALTERERDVLAVMAEGKSNAGIADSLRVSEAAVEKHVTSIFKKLQLGHETSDNRRVRAVLAHIDSTQRS